MRRKILFGLTGFVVLALGAGGYWYATLARELQPEPAPQALLAAEDALAMPGLAALGHLDVGYAVRAELAFYGPEDAGALAAPLMNDDGVLQSLQSRGIDIRDAIDHALFGYGALGEELGSAGILLGRFPVDRLTEALAAALEVEQGTSGIRSFLRITTQDPETCGTETFVAHIAEDRIVVASKPAILSTILDRLETARPAERDLTDWRANRTGNVASLAVIIPPVDALDAAARSPIERAMAGAMKEEMMPLRGIYAGIGLSTLPPSVGLEGWIETDDATWPVEILAEAQSWRADMVRNVGNTIPTLLHLYDRLEMQADGTRLRYALTLDESFKDDVGLAFTELLALAFSGMGADPGAGSIREEEREEEIIPLDQVPLASVERSHGRLEPFGEEFHNWVSWQAGSGPFGLRIKSLQFNADDPDIVDIELEASSSEIPTISLYTTAEDRRDARAELVVTGVLGRDGRNLLRAEPCGNDRNEKGAELSPRSHSRHVDGDWIEVPILTGSKTVRLEPGARPDDVASLTGFVRLTLPTDIETHRIPMPEAGQIFETEDLRLRFQGDDAHAVAYDASGDDSRLLEVRALNRGGDYLASAGSGSGPRFGLVTRRVEKSFRGEPAEIELLIARDAAVRDYTFTINAIQPSFPENEFHGPDSEQHWSEAMPRSSFAQLIEAAVTVETCEGQASGRRVGPFLLCLASLQKWGDGFFGQITIHAPNSKPLATQISALEIIADSISTRDQSGTAPDIHVSDPQQSSIYVSGLGGYGTGEMQSRQNLMGVLAEPEEINDGAAMSGIRGRLALRMPSALLDPQPLDITSLGNSATLPNGAQVTVIGYQYRSSGSVAIDFQGRRADLVEIVQRASDGAVLGSPNPVFEPGDAPDSWTLHIQVMDPTVTLDFVLAADFHAMEFPFDLALPE